MAAGAITHVRVDGTLLSGTLATIYTVPSSRVVISREASISSVDTTNTQYPEVQDIPSGGSAGDASVLIRRMSAGANGVLPGGLDPISDHPMLEAGDFIQARNTDGAGGSGTANKLNISLRLTLKEV